MGAHGEGKKQHADFVAHRLQSTAVAFHAVMKLTPNSLMVPIWCILFRPDASIKSFRDYADKKVIPYIERQLANTKRVDVIWDHYLPDILKATTRQRRGTGIRQRMRHDGNGTFPRNWNSYLQNASNKVKLFGYLSVAIAQTVFCEGKVVTSTSIVFFLQKAERHRMEVLWVGHLPASERELP